MNYLVITLKSIAYALIAVVLILAMLLVGVRIFGIEIYTVLSGSMEPEYHTGGIIYVTEVDPQELKVGDDITYRLSGSTTATHRIIEVIRDGEDISFRTQGIANDHPDAAPVSADKIIGKAVFSLPYLGYLAAYVQSPPGLYVAVAVGIALILFVILIDAFADMVKKNSATAAAVAQAEAEKEIICVPVPDAAEKTGQKSVPEADDGDK